jgi:hypothetical protein
MVAAAVQQVIAQVEAAASGEQASVRAAHRPAQVERPVPLGAAGGGSGTEGTDPGMREQQQTAEGFKRERGNKLVPACVIFT